MSSDTENGFTLLEVLTAVSMLVVLLSVLFATLTASLGVMDKASADTQIYDMARVTLHRFAGDLESSFLIPGRVREDGAFEKESGAFVARGGFFNGRTGFYLRFPTKARVVPDGSNGRPGESEVTYELRRKGDGGSLTLIRAEAPPGDEASEKGTAGHVLCEGLAGRSRFRQSSGNLPGPFQSFRGKQGKIFEEKPGQALILNAL